MSAGLQRVEASIYASANSSGKIRSFSTQTHHSNQRDNNKLQTARSKSLNSRKPAEKLHFARVTKTTEPTARTFSTSNSLPPKQRTVRLFQFLDSLQNKHFENDTIYIGSCHSLRKITWTFLSTFCLSSEDEKLRTTDRKIQLGSTFERLFLPSKRDPRPGHFLPFPQFGAETNVSGKRLLLKDEKKTVLAKGLPLKSLLAAITFKCVQIIFCFKSF